MSITKRLAATIFIVSISGISLTAAFVYFIARGTIITQVENAIVGKAESQAARTRQILDHNTSQITTLVTRPLVLRYASLRPEQRSREDLTELTALLQVAKQAFTGTRRVELADLDGQIIASTEGGRIGTDISATSSFIEGKTRFVHDLLDKEDGELVFTLSAPIVLDGNSIGVGTILADSSTLIDIATDYTGLGETGETDIAGRISAGPAVYMTPVRFDRNAALSLLVVDDPRTQAIAKALHGNEGAYGVAADYRNTPVFSAGKRIAKTGWGLVVKIDEDEALAPLRNISDLLIAFVLLLAGLSLVVSLLMSRIGTRDIRSLTSAARRIASSAEEVSIAISSHDDEISELGSAFNDLSKRVNRSRSELAALVQERTATLMRKVSELENTKKAILNLMEDLEENRREVIAGVEHVEAQRTKLLSVLERLPTAVVLVDIANDRIDFANEMARKLLGFRFGQSAQSRTDSVILRLVNEIGIPLLPEERPANIAARTGKAAMRDKAYLVLADGRKITLKVDAVPINNARDAGLSIVEILDDITKEEQINKSKTEFVSLASHQLRTPLSTVRWYSEVLLAGEAGKLKARQLEYVREIDAANKRMIDLVNALLNVSRIDLGMFAIEPIDVDVKKIVVSLLKDFSRDMKNRELKVTTSFAPVAPQLRADANLLRIIIQNVLSNAIKYTPKGGRVALSVTENKEGFRLDVSDTGYGIPAHEHHKVFTKLFRGDNIQIRETDGTGLGLYIVKSVVDNAGGRVWFESEENKGTTIHVTFPPTGMHGKQGSKSLQ